MKDFSVVVPVYGCPEALEPLCDRTVSTISKLGKSYEIVLVNDGCPKDSWKKIIELCEKNENIVGINLSRNFGQIHSTNAGITYADGEYVVLMDCDLQDKPEGIADLYNKMSEGYDIVFAKRKNRKDSYLTKFFSKLFYKVYNYFNEGYLDGDIGNFCIAKRKVVDEYNKIKDRNKSFTPTLAWMGFKQTAIEIESDERFEGKSSYNFSKKVDLAIDMLTSQSVKPLKAVINLGIMIAGVSFVYIVVQILKYFILNDIPEGWTSVIASIFLMSGIILICLGGVGIYIGNIFKQTGGMPEYIVEEIINGR